jgi:hypothetical protein
MALEMERSARSPAYQAYLLLRIGFVGAPILFGLDKFFNFMVRWPDYLAPWIANLAHVVSLSPQQFMYIVGVIEIVAGVVVFVTPRYGSLLVALWLAGIIINLLTGRPPEYYDIALRDFGLFLAALSLNRLATAIGVTTIRSELARSRRPQLAG